MELKAKSSILTLTVSQEIIYSYNTSLCAGKSVSCHGNTNELHVIANIETLFVCLQNQKLQAFTENFENTHFPLCPGVTSLHFLQPNLKGKLALQQIDLQVVRKGHSHPYLLLWNFVNCRNSFIRVKKQAIQAWLHSRK